MELTKKEIKLIIDTFEDHENNLESEWSVELGVEEKAFLNKLKEAISVTRCSTQLPDELQPVLAKIEHIDSLGTSNYWEVVYFDGNWRSFSGSKTFEDGEKVVKWNYCKAIV